MSNIYYLIKLGICVTFAGSISVCRCLADTKGLTFLGFDDGYDDGFKLSYDTKKIHD